MKLATLKDRTRDGMLVVVSRDLTRFVSARPIASTLQGALDDWEHVAPRLEDLAHMLELGAVPSERFHEHDALSPLPRAYQFVDAAAYANGVELARQAEGAEVADSVFGAPALRQAASDAFLGPRDPIRAAGDALDFEAGIAVVVGDVAETAGLDAGGKAIRLVMLANGIALRDRLARAPTAFSPVAVSPDELGEAWDGGKLHLPLIATLNGKAFGKANAGIDMTFDFPALVAAAASSRPLSAGTILGSGPVSNRGAEGGHSSIAEARAVETLSDGSAQAPFLKAGDTLRIEMKDAEGHTIFGAIERSVVRSEGVQDEALLPSGEKVPAGG